MYLPFKTSKRRLREAENARKNRAEIVKALSQGQINRRDLFKWGLFTSAGLLLCKNGLSPFAKSAFAQGVTGVPATPVTGAVPFSHALPRLDYVPPTPLTKVVKPNGEWEALFPDGLLPLAQPSAKRLSWHTDFSAHQAGNTAANPFINPITKRGPMEGRPPGSGSATNAGKNSFRKSAITWRSGNVRKPSSTRPGRINRRTRSGPCTISEDGGEGKAADPALEGPLW